MKKIYLTIKEGDTVRNKKTREKFIAKKIDMNTKKMFIKPISGSSKSRNKRAAWVGFNGFQGISKKHTVFRGRYNVYDQWLDIGDGISIKQLVEKAR